jgi:stearoyl-CoA desaturase (Delta-9 desaturase)
MKDKPTDSHEDIVYPPAAAFLSVHLACLAVLVTGMTVRALVLGFALYWIRIFGISAGYHRYFSHRAFKTSRFFQFCLGFLSQTSAQSGMLWWAEKHRQHHRYSDTELDVHSPRRHSVFYAHVGWIFAPQHASTDYQVVRDLACYPELRWLDRHPYLPATVVAFLSWLIAGWPGLVVGFCWSTVAVWHVTFSINSIAHLVGRQPYVTGDFSRNNWLLALLTMGEGWHNNHHAYQSAARQGFRWWQYDVTFYILKLLSFCGILWELQSPPASLLRGEQRLGSRVIEKVAQQLAASFPIDVIAGQARDALAHTARWAELKSRAQVARQQAEEFVTELRLPQIPTLEEVRLYAQSRLAKTPSLDEIATRTRQVLTELVSACLIEAAVSSKNGDGAFLGRVSPVVASA